MVTEAHLMAGIFLGFEQRNLKIVKKSKHWKLLLQ